MSNPILVGFGSRRSDPLGYALVVAPLIAGCVGALLGLAFGGTRLESAASTATDIVGLLAVVLTAVLIGFDLPRTKPKTTLQGPVMNALAAIGLWLIVYPRYLYLRDRVAMPKRFWAGIVATVVFCVGDLVGAACGTWLRTPLTRP